MKCFLTAIIMAVLVVGQCRAQKNRHTNTYKIYEKDTLTTDEKDFGGNHLYSEGIKPAWRNVHRYGQKIVKTDAQTGSAVESVPFDRPFFLEIRRPTYTTVDTTSGEPKTSTHFMKISKAVIRIDLDPKGDSLSPINDTNDTAKNFYLRIGTLRPSRIYKVVIKWDKVAEPEIFSLTTSEDLLSKRIGQRLMSQFGIITPFFKDDGKPKILTPLISLALYYHVRPINPDIPMRAYRPFAAQRFSTLVGVTLTSFAKSGQRANLLGGNNLLFGMGYQPLDILRVSYGALFFKEVGLDPRIERRKGFAATPYLSLTLDIKLKDLFGGIFTTLGFK